jgi:peptidoglycan/LPS O-acetylase OafA/YrhL
MTKAEDLRPLTSLRFIAAMMIVLLHAGELFTYEWMIWVRFPLNNGVSFFFVLSGFILTHVYSLRPNTPYGYFLWTRFARLWPTHLATLALLVVSVPDGWATFYGEGMFSKWWTLLANLTLTQSLFPYMAYVFSWNGVSWSISTEFFFYLAFPFLLINLHRNWHIKLILSLLPLLALALLAPTIDIPAKTNEVDQASTFLITYANPLFRGFEFCLGMSAWVIWNGLSRRQRFRGHATTWEVFALAVATVWFSLVFYSVLVPFANTMPVLGPWLTVSGSSWVFAVLIVALAHGEGVVGKLLSAKLCVWLGEISFAIYMVHQILLKIFVTRLPEWTHDVFYLPALIALSAGIHHLIEKPPKSYLLRLWHQRRPGRSQSGAGA